MSVSSASADVGVRVDAEAGIDVAAVPFAELRNQRDIAVSALGAQERERFASYAAEADGERFALGRWLLRLVLAHRRRFGQNNAGFAWPADPAVIARASGIGFVERPGCAPLLSGAVTVPADEIALRFSLSRSADLAVVATGFVRALGVDVEDLGRAALFDETVRDAYFNAAETEFPDPAQKSCSDWLLRGWTAKEAIAKAAGQGLRLAFREIIVRNDAVIALPPGLPDPAECRLCRVDVAQSTISAAWW